MMFIVLGSSPALIPCSRINVKRSLPDVFPELRTMPRKALESLRRRIKDDAEELLSWGSSYRQLTMDYHANFDLVSCEELFPYVDKPGNFKMEYAEPGLLVQHVLTHCPKLAGKWDRALRETGHGAASNPWRTVLGYDEFQRGSKFDFDRSKAVMCLYFNWLK